MKNALSKISFLLCLLTLTSCMQNTLLFTGVMKVVDELDKQFKEDEDIVQSIQSPEVEAFLTDADEMNYLMDTGRILSSSSVRDRQQIRGTIERVKVSVVLLDANPNNLSALTSLKTAFEFLSTIVVTERDQPRINVILDQARSFMVRYARIQGVDFRSLRWEIFSYRFSDDILPFGSTDVPIKWSLQFVQQERYAIRVRGENTRAVLLSPTFDLTNVTKPAYQLRHSLQVEEHYIPRPEFNRDQILNTAFRAYVSSDFKDGDTYEAATWTRVGLGDLPTGLNFNTEDSGIIELSQFAGKKITMAFIFDNNGSIHNHQLSWAIERFELYGISEKLNYTARPQPFNPDDQDEIGETIWHHDFNIVQLGNLQQVTVDGAPHFFENTERNGDKYVKIQQQGVVGTKLLYSPPVSLVGIQSPYIRINHTINFYGEQFQESNDVSLQVAAYDASVNIEELDWKTIEFEKNNPPGTNWDIYKSEFVKLPEELIGKEIVVGWSHTSRENSTPVWQMHDTEIRDIPEDQL